MGRLVPGREYDYIVVGAGTAGCALAYRLGESGTFRVLVLEAGGGDRSLSILVPAGRLRMSDKYDWGYSAEPDSSRYDRTESWESGKVLGGSSSINGMIWVRGAPQDYDRWEALGCDGWDYTHVLPYFKRSETFEGGGDRYRGDSGPQHVSYLHLHHPLTDCFVHAAQQVGFPFNPDYNGERADGVAYGQVSQRRGLRDSAARAYLRPAMRRPNVDVLTDTRVRRVVLDGKRAIGVEFERRGKVTVATCLREVILSAGAIGSPKLLMLSGIGPRAELESAGIRVHVDLPGVGRNLQNHLYMTMVHEVDRPTLNRELTPWNLLKQGVDLILRGRGTATSAFGHGLLFGSVGGSGIDYEAIFAPYGLLTTKIVGSGQDARAREHHELMSVPAVTTRVGLMVPKSRGCITVRSADPEDPPLIRYESIADARDVANLMAACRRVREIFAASPMADRVVRELEPGDRVWSDSQWEDAIRRSATIGKHAAGTCRMGSDESAVVDPRLRVHGVDGLRIIDLSVTPVINSGNTCAPATMIGERGADFVLSDGGRKEVSDAVGRAAT